MNEFLKRETLFKYFIYLFVERGEGWEKEERNIDAGEKYRISCLSHTP